ncbi:HesA/MoeB/ThiF family protein [Saccharothrix syringae]|uniref:ThiF family adenylyltransferase n=1 Tax=Saccharothrix syringae TaxID=103733 RepID=A0A5Q0GWZ4_SACSY|nr:ThiF family adenylyltransferase [Saccharothrix syringae]QFZ18626.1 ThiF family adenylyltransferase [Saccharothrix syringae]
MLRPRIKYEHRPVRLGDGHVRIGGALPGVAATIPDPDGTVWALLVLLDGSRTVGQAVADLVHHHPDEPPDTVRAAIDTLAAAGYLEDADEPAPEGLTDADLERYGRGRALWRSMDTAPRTTSWHAQLALRRARVTVVGVGGVGSAAALALAQSGIGALHLVEPDVVELSNLNRQVLYTEHDLGRPKVDAAIEALRRHNSDVEITGERTTVDGTGVLRRLATGCDVLLMGADTPRAIRSWTNRACLATGTAWVDGGYRGPRVSVGVFVPGHGRCRECARPAAQARTATPVAFRPGDAWEDGVHAVNAVSAGIAGLLSAHAVMSLITGIPRLQATRWVTYNLVTLRHAEDDCEAPDPDCPACGPAAA